jgi:hypothetical protein
MRMPPTDPEYTPTIGSRWPRDRQKEADQVRVYLIKDEDLDRLRTLIDRDPRWGEQGGSSQVLSKEEELEHGRAHRWFDWQICAWIDSVKKP